MNHTHKTMWLCFNAIFYGSTPSRPFITGLVCPDTNEFHARRKPHVVYIKDLSCLYERNPEGNKEYRNKEIVLLLTIFISMFPVTRLTNCKHLIFISLHIFFPLVFLNQDFYELEKKNLFLRVVVWNQTLFYELLWRYPFRQHTPISLSALPTRMDLEKSMSGFETTTQKYISRFL